MATEGHRSGGHQGNDPSWADRLREMTPGGGRSRVVLAVVALLAALSSTGVAVASAIGGPSPASRRAQVVTAAARLPRGARAIGSLSASAPVSGAVALKLPNEPALQRFLSAVTNPHSPLFHHYLSRGQFAQRFGPHAAALAAVEHQLRGEGLAVTHVSSNRMLVSFTGTAARIESAFGTGLERVRLPNGAIGRATTAPVRLPAAVAPQVAAVIGLDQLVHNHTAIERRTRLGGRRTPAAVQPRTTGGGPSACAAATKASSQGGLTDQQVATAYGLNPLYAAGDTASTQTVDIFEEEPYAATDIAAFDQCYFGQNRSGNVHLIGVDGGAGAGPGVGEAALDIENISALAPAAKINVYSGPLTSLGGVDIWNAIAVADDARQISTSWGLCETAVQEGSPGQQQVESEIFQQIAAQGQSVFSAAGDSGSDDCAGQSGAAVDPVLSVDDPASQPYVTGVGGTTMVGASTPPSETVWNNGAAGGGGGGGISETWAMPSWQSSSAVAQSPAQQACSNYPSGSASSGEYHLPGYFTTLAAGTLCREVPDVSAVADPQTGMTIYWNGSWGIIGGTSSAAPIWAAIMAEINASSYCSSASVGFVSPLLYQIASSPGYVSAFNDITSGNNDSLMAASSLDYPSGPGYDLASGLGTPRVTNPNGTLGLAQQLCRDAAAGTGSSAPQVTGLSPSSGPNGGGTQVRITGTNFGAAAGTVYFGSVPVTSVISWTATQIVVDAPAYTPPPGTPAGAPGRALVTVAPSGGAGSSAPSGKSIFDYTANAPGGHPVIDYISPAYGPNAGGGTVDIVGANLAGATQVTFGDLPATIVGVADRGAQTELQVRVPATDQKCAYGTEATEGICAVKVTVTNASGQSSGPDPIPAYSGPIVFSPDGSFAAPAGCGCEVVPAPDEYDYAAAPKILSVSPSYMDEGGSSAATITGQNFNLLSYEWTSVGDPTQAANEDFQLLGISATSLSVVILPDPNSTTLPDQSTLTVQSAGQPSNQYPFDYAGVPELDSISKHVVSQSSPGSLTITGRGLQQVIGVLFEDQAGSGAAAGSSLFTAQSSTQLTVMIPSFFAIPTDVLVCSVSGCSSPNPTVDTLIYAFPGRPTLTASSPKSGPSTGGTQVTLQGTLDSNITAVYFGTRRATLGAQPVGSPSGPVTVTAPAGKPYSKVNITISTAGGQLVGAPTSAVTPNATFTYGPPTGFRLPAPQVGRNGKLSFHLKLPQGGRLTAMAVTHIRKNGRARSVTFGRAARTIRRARRLTLVITPWRAARIALAAGKKLRVRVTVTFTPREGFAVTHSRTVAVRRR
ncbi:MAG TPA: IPT/TIG domain-containing protein [Solirubrobacteraceae bacterium]|nr:IPT/TIG domain-containing protein [Solirubrobacteraceae bacterium]